MTISNICVKFKIGKWISNPIKPFVKLTLPHSVKFCHNNSTDRKGIVHNPYLKKLLLY